MARYQIQATHTSDGCLQTLDEIMALGSETLQKWDFGCAVGNHDNHVCYSVYEAASPDAVRQMLPERNRAEAKITEVGKFTADQILSFHK